MRSALKRGIVTIAACIGLAPSVDAQQPVETFDSVWAIVNRSHFDSTFNGVDWKAVRDQFRPRAEAARNNDLLRTILVEMLGRLDQSHFSLLPQEVTSDSASYGGGPGELGMDVRVLDGEVVVVDVRADGPAARAGIGRGWVIEHINDHRMSTIIERAHKRAERMSPNALAGAQVRALLHGDVGSIATLRMRDGSNRTHALPLERIQDEGLPVKVGHLPVFYASLHSRRLDATPAGIGLIGFNAWMVPLVARFDTAVDRLRNTDGIIIDLRGNPGGVGVMSVGLANQFVDSAASLGTMQMRRGKLELNLSPRRVDTRGERVEPYSGPVAVLSDELTASTSEMFIGGLQALDRIRVFGQTTAGAVLPAMLEKLPNGDVFMHAIANFVTSDGTRLEGRGAVPDEKVSTTRADLLAGRDPVLEAATEWIKQQRSVKSRIQGR